MDEIFSEAVERLLAGEPLSTIVASYPPESQPELRQLLVVIEMTEQLKTQPVPQPSAVRRRATRAMFLEEAAARRTEMNEVLGMPPEAAAIPAAASPWHALLDRAREFWNALFDVPIMRLAPLALVFLAVYLATFGVVSAAKAALPGDAAYPFKQWIRDQRVALAPPDQRIKAVQDVEEEVADEMEALAHEQRDRSSLLTEHSQRLIYYGQVGKLMRLGPLLVAPNYQPDANSETLEPAVIEGILEPGVTVELVYKMLPGNPSVVQGKSLRVIDLPRPTPPPTSTPLPPANCQRAIPQTWVPYPVQPGMTLAELADRSGATAARLAAVNCLPDGRLPAGENVFVPDNFYVSVTPTNLPTPVPTVPPTPIPMATPVPPPTVTPSPEPPTTEPTEVPTGDATLEPTGEPTTAPTEQATSQPTGEPTNAPTNAPTGEATAEPTPEPTLGATETVVATLTSAPTALPGDETTPTAEATAAAAPTAAAGATPAPVEATPVTTAEPEATSAAGEGGDGATPTSTPVDQVTPATQREPTPTRQPTVDPTQAPPTATPLPPPTAAPPTPVPPPPEPPPPTSPPASNESTGDASPGGVAAGGPAPVEVPSETAP